MSSNGWGHTGIREWVVLSAIALMAGCSLAKCAYTPGGGIRMAGASELPEISIKTTSQSVAPVDVLLEVFVPGHDHNLEVKAELLDASGNGWTDYYKHVGKWAPLRTPRTYKSVGSGIWTARATLTRAIPQKDGPLVMRTFVSNAVTIKICPDYGTAKC